MPSEVEVGWQRTASALWLEAACQAECFSQIINLLLFNPRSASLDFQCDSSGKVKNLKSEMECACGTRTQSGTQREMEDRKHKREQKQTKP
jgi:hypothetical protein